MKYLLNIVFLGWGLLGTWTVMATPFVWNAKLDGTHGGLVVKVEMPPHHYLYQHTVKITATVNGAELKPTISPNAVSHHDASFGDTMIYPAPSAVWIYRVPAGTTVAAVNIASQGCREATGTTAAMCFMPEKKFLEVKAAAVGTTVPGVGSTVTKKDSALPANASSELTKFYLLLPQFEVKTAGGLMDAKTFLQFLQAKSSGAGKLLGDYSLWLMFLLVLVGGIGLNLTPCVLPMIPVTLAIIGAGKQADSPRKGWWRGTFYGMGMAWAYCILGMVTITTGAKFGNLNSTAWFNFLVAAVFLALALAMFDLYTIDLAKFGSGRAPVVDKTRMAQIFLLGSLAAILAGACVAPVVIAVLVYATAMYSEGHVTALLLPLLLGIGMALPWPFAGAGMAVIPKPGRWMVRVKYGFGVVILLAAGYYGWQGYHLLQGKNDELNKINQQLELSLQTGRPVLVDFWADWCKNCLYMDRTTFADGDVIRALSGYTVVKFRAENLNDPDLNNVMDRLKLQGLPAFVVFSPKR